MLKTHFCYLEMNYQILIKNYLKKRKLAKDKKYQNIGKHKPDSSKLL